MIGRGNLGLLGTIAGCPALQAGSISLDSGEDAWRSFIDVSTPPSRQAVLEEVAPWFTPELVATEASKDRLGRWFRFGRPSPSRRVVDRDLVVIGLDRLRATLVAAVRRLPPPVQHYLLHHVWIIGVGRGLNGWTWQSPPYPTGPLVLVALEGKADVHNVVAVLGHECAHAWLIATAPADCVPTLRERHRAASLPRRLARQWNRLDLLFEQIQRDRRAAEQVERQACQLAAAWGFRGVVADAEACAEAAGFAALREDW